MSERWYLSDPTIWRRFVYEEMKEVKTDDELKKEYTYQRPTEAARVLHEEVNSRLLDLAIWVEHNLPEGRDKSLFHTKLEEARMWANKSIAMNHDKL